MEKPSNTQATLRPRARGQWTRLLGQPVEILDSPSTEQHRRADTQHAFRRASVCCSDPPSKCVCFPGGSDGKVSACSRETWVQSLGREDPLEKEMATQSSTLAWKIPRTEEPGRLHDLATKQQ